MNNCERLVEPVKHLSVAAFPYAPGHGHADHRVGDVTASRIPKLQDSVEVSPAAGVESSPDFLSLRTTN